MIPLEAKQFFSSILVVFKIKLRKLCYTGNGLEDKVLVFGLKLSSAKKFLQKTITGLGKLINHKVFKFQ